MREHVVSQMRAEDVAPGEVPLHVVATAGHVDHGKSALILRLTGIDPDRLAEEKRRGLTIDLGFAWTTLPSGREIGFVDVPGHERFIRNMLAGVGPVRLVLFVVAADEGWKPQSEEHLQIVDVLGVEGALVALTKRDLVDGATLTDRTEEIRRRLEGSRLEGAPVVPCSATTGEGVDELRSALDEMVDDAPRPDRGGRPRQFLDRVFSIRGAGTVVTGTLTGGPLRVGQEVEVLPQGYRARIRALQTHRRTIEVAAPVSRVAVNLAGTPRTELERGDVLALPGQWKPTRVIEGWVQPVRGLAHPLTARGAYKFYAGSTERDARIRLFDRTELRPGEASFARITLSRPAVLDFKDAFVLREAGRRETVGGGLVLDTDPPTRPGPDPSSRLRARLEADRRTLTRRLVSERGAVAREDLARLTGLPRDEAMDGAGAHLGAFVVDPELVTRAHGLVTDILAAHHQAHPLRPGIDVVQARALVLEAAPAFADPGLVDALLQDMAERGHLVRDGTVLRLPHHRLSTVGREEADRLVATVRDGEPAPPSVKELLDAGFPLELIRAVCTEQRLVRVSPDIVATPEFIARAESVLRGLANPPGVTVSTFREALGTSRKYAVPMLKYFDAKGVTRRQGEVRVLRSPAPG